MKKAKTTDAMETAEILEKIQEGLKGKALVFSKEELPPAELAARMTRMHAREEWGGLSLQGVDEREREKHIKRILDEMYKELDEMYRELDETADDG